MSILLSLSTVKTDLFLKPFFINYSNNHYRCISHNIYNFFTTYDFIMNYNDQKIIFKHVFHLTKNQTAYQIEKLRLMYNEYYSDIFYLQLGFTNYEKCTSIINYFKTYEIL